MTTMIKYARSMRWLLILPALLFLLGNAEFEALFAPKAELWERWQPHAKAETVSVDYEAWNDFLARYRQLGEKGVARVAYAKVNDRNKAKLDQFIVTLQEVPVSKLTRAQQYAFWVNLYNALTIQLVLDYYPIRSIENVNISPGLFSSGPWDAELATIDGTSVTLNDIEHRILRPIWQDARTHYVINCASVGCPNLPPKALTADNHEVMLDQAARTYINHPRGVTIQGDKLYLSSIYAWFADDFGEDLTAHLKRYLPKDKAALLHEDMARVYDYNWSLNDVVRYAELENN